jgi:hypothetical protein
MKLDFTEINGKKIKVSDMEYLYSYMNEDGKWIAVFEYEGEEIKKEIIQHGTP